MKWTWTNCWFSHLNLVFPIVEIPSNKEVNVHLHPGTVNTKIENTDFQVRPWRSIWKTILSYFFFMPSDRERLQPLEQSLSENWPQSPHDSFRYKIKQRRCRTHPEKEGNNIQIKSLERRKGTYCYLSKQYCDSTRNISTRFSIPCEHFSVRQLKETKRTLHLWVGFQVGYEAIDWGSKYLKIRQLHNT